MDWYFLDIFSEIILPVCVFSSRGRAWLLGAGTCISSSDHQFFYPDSAHSHGQMTSPRYNQPQSATVAPEKCLCFFVSSVFFPVAFTASVLSASHHLSHKSFFKASLTAPSACQSPFTSLFLLWCLCPKPHQPASASGQKLPETSVSKQTVFPKNLYGQ